MIVTRSTPKRTYVIEREKTEDTEIRVRPDPTATKFLTMGTCMRPFRKDSSFVVGEKTEENKGGRPDYVDGFELSHWGNALHAAVDLPTLGLQGSLHCGDHQNRFGCVWLLGHTVSLDARERK
jgi:hypothetical protein